RSPHTPREEASACGPRCSTARLIYPALKQVSTNAVRVSYFSAPSFSSSCHNGARSVGSALPRVPFWQSTSRDVPQDVTQGPVRPCFTPQAVRWQLPASDLRTFFCVRASKECRQRFTLWVDLPGHWVPLEADSKKDERTRPFAGGLPTGPADVLN